MLFTPEERRALLALTALLLLGQGVAWWEEQRKARPDQALGQWLERLALARGDSAASGLPAGATLQGCAVFPMGDVPGSAAAGSLSETPSRGTSSRPAVRVEGLEEAPPGILECGRIRINEADAGDLESLPGIGPSLAGKILVERDRAGPFREAEDLLRVSGIGPKKLARLRDLVDFSVTDPPAAAH